MRTFLYFAPVAVRILGLVALFFTPYWYVGIMGFAALMIFNMTSAPKLRLAVEMSTQLAGIWGVYLFPHISESLRQPLAIGLLVLSLCYFAVAIYGLCLQKEQSPAF